MLAVMSSLALLALLAFAVSLVAFLVRTSRHRSSRGWAVAMGRSLVRALGQALNSAVARFPWNWRLFSAPVRRFFYSVAVGWDERVRSDSPEYLEPLVAALDRLEASPGRCRKPFPRSASQKVSNHSVELVRALARRPMATAPQNAQLRIWKSFVRSSCTPVWRSSGSAPLGGVARLELSLKLKG